MRRGMTRKALARESGVSERYLANLEGGEGNVSILLLQRIAGALSLAITELVSDADPRSAEVALIHRILERVPARRLSKLRQQLIREFGGARQDRTQRVALVGLRGAGKSTLGAKLARERGIAFVELDREIEREAGTSLSEVFLLYGQSGYRRYERRCLENVLDRHPRCVIATGGSIVTEPGTYEVLLSACFTVWVKALPEEHMARVLAQGDMRPMSGNVEAMDDLRRILASRSALYAQADLVVDTAGKKIEQSLRELKTALRG